MSTGMKVFFQAVRRCGLAALWCATSLPLAAFADTSVGNITYTRGKVFVQAASGERHLAVSNAALHNGDTIQTARDAEVVLVMADHQRIYLRGGTLYRIDDFHYSTEEPAQSHSITSLLRGGLRVVSGLIGKQGNPDAYQLKTQMATIGIRGTEWSVLERDSEFEKQTGTTADRPEDGLRMASGVTSDSAPPAIRTGENIRVYHGLIDVRTEIYHERIPEGLGTIINSPRSPITLLPGDEVQPVTPSDAASACE
ncbi:FecR protein [Burkholderia sp. lig30]|jgi:hypothetical protein|uniref:FecR family protein n=1 Tax=Burkholderia sp. lig30 TaxID=1192124 RepID=UPI00046141B1|nr:FecR domain-containing protein [Burkholderia sp. lig30]KDB06517.1 FecR protein [Burkholderia sp. lig30]